jgi:hypothetical protein
LLTARGHGLVGHCALGFTLTHDGEDFLLDGVWHRHAQPNRLEDSGCLNFKPHFGVDFNVVCLVPQPLGVPVIIIKTWVKVDGSNRFCGTLFPVFLALGPTVPMLD